MGYAGELVIGHSSKLLFWEIEESVEELVQSLKEEKIVVSKDLLVDSSSEKRTLERLAVLSVLAHQFPNQAVQLQYHLSGKPYLEGVDFEVSISHSGDLVVVMVSNQKCGVDIQQYKPSIGEGVDFFVGTDDNINQTDKKDPELLHVVWGAKEALYKKYGGELDFCADIRIKSVTKNEGAIVECQVSTGEMGSVVDESVFFEMYKNAFLLYS